MYQFKNMLVNKHENSSALDYKWHDKNICGIMSKCFANEIKVASFYQIHQGDII